MKKDKNKKSIHEVEVLPSIEVKKVSTSKNTDLKKSDVKVIEDNSLHYTDTEEDFDHLESEVEVLPRDFEVSQNGYDSDYSDDENLPINFDSLPDTTEVSSNKLKQYMREISRYDLLSREQEYELAKALKDTGDIEVAKKLVVSNLRLVVKIALEYKYAYSNVMDLIQEGNVGLMKAVSLFDPDKGAKLSYYASWWIKSYILKFILDNFRLVKIGTTNEQKKLFYNLMREKERLIAQGINPDHQTLAENLNVSEKAVALMDMRLGEGQGEVSLDRPVGDDSNSKVSDFIDSGSDFVEDLSYHQSLELLQDNLDDFIKGLKPRDREIFQKRLLDDAPSSLQEIADEYGVSRERIRQIESRLIENLRLYMSNYIR